MGARRRRADSGARSGRHQTTSPNRNRVGRQSFLIRPPGWSRRSHAAKSSSWSPRAGSPRDTRSAASRVGPAEKPLDLHFVADLPLVEADHVPFVEDEQADVVEEGRIVAERKVELLRRRDDDVTFPDRVLVEAADSDAAVERILGTASWTSVVLDHVMDRCDRDRCWGRHLALFRLTEQGSLGIGNRRLGHHCLACWPCHPALACRSISIECDATQRSRPVETRKNPNDIERRVGGVPQGVR